MKWCCTLAALVCLGAGCHAGSTSVSSEQDNGQCPLVATILTGGEPEGAACSSYETCAPSCCSCSNGDGNTFLASECDVGACAHPTVACDDAQDPTLCP